MREAANRHGDGVRVASGEGCAQVPGELLHLQGARDYLRVGGGERNYTADAQEVGRNQHVYVQDVAVQYLAMKYQLAQPDSLIAQFDVERVFGGAQAGRRMTTRADAADPAGDMRGLVVGTPAQHRFEETRRFNDLEFAFFDCAVAHVDDNVAMTLDAGHMVHIDFDILSHCRQSSFGAANVDIGRGSPLAGAMLVTMGDSSPMCCIW